MSRQEKELLQRQDEAEKLLAEMSRRELDRRVEARRAEEEARRRKAEEARRAEEERLRREQEERERREREAIAAEEKRKQEIIDYLHSRGQLCLYHFTAQKNLPSIRQHGLVAWGLHHRQNISCPSPGGNDTSHNLDTRDGLQNKVRLSFCKDHPMAWRKWKDDGDTLVLLEIDLSVAAQKGVIFTDVNATKNGARQGSDLSALKSLVDFNAVNTSYLRSEDPLFPYHQAEIMVEGSVPPDKILNLNNPNIIYPK